MGAKCIHPLSWDIEEQFARRCGGPVFGTDEAGRGPLAGRVYAAAVLLDPATASHSSILALNDSKKISEIKRRFLSEEIIRLALGFGVAFAEVDEIETVNILNASLTAMTRAAAKLFSQLEQKGIPRPHGALVDGNKVPLFPFPTQAVIGGDGLCPSIAAASILAKTARDAYCVEVLDARYPQYGFAKHKGYGTAEHYRAVEVHGLCPAHRKSFFKKYKNGELCQSSEVGKGQNDHRLLVREDG